MRSNDCTNELNQIIEQIQNELKSIDDDESIDLAIVNTKANANKNLRSKGGSRMLNNSIANINKVIYNFNLDSDKVLSDKSNDDKSLTTTKQSSSSFFKDLTTTHSQASYFRASNNDLSAVKWCKWPIWFIASNFEFCEIKSIK